MAGKMLGREDFNRLTSAIFDNTYNSESADVLRADLKIAQKTGDKRAEESINRDLQRVIKGGPVTDNTSTGNSPVPEARNKLNSFMQLAPDLEAAIFSADQDRTKASGQAVAASKEAGSAQASSVQTAAEMEIGVQEVHKQLLRAIGLDVNDPQSFLNSEIRRQTMARNERETIDREIVDLESVSFFQDPFGFLSAQPRLQQLTSQYNNLARIENRSNEEISRIQSIAESAMKLTPAKNADLIRKKAAEDATAVAKLAEARAAEYSAQNSAGHAKALMDMFTARHNVFASMLQVQSLEENIADRRSRQEDSNYWRGVKRDEIKEREEQKAAEKQRETALVVGINTFRKAINGSAAPDLTPEDVKRMPAELKGAWYEVILRGNYGNNYYEAVPFIQRFGNPAAAASSGNAAMMQLVRNIETRAQELAPEILNREKFKNLRVQIKPDQALMMAYNEIYASDAGSAMKGADKGTIKGDSPYAIDYDAAAALAKAKPGGVVSKSLLAAKERSNTRSLNTGFSASMLLNEVEARVIAGEATPRQAAEEVARFYATQSVASYETNGLRYLSLPQPTDWVISPDGTGKQRVDLMDPTKLENYLTAKIAAERSRNRVGLGNSFVPWR